MEFVASTFLGYSRAFRLNFMLKSCKFLGKHSLIFPSKLSRESCAKSKSHTLPFKLSSTNYYAPFDLIVSDVWGSYPIISRLGYKYFIIFIDQVSRYTWIFFLKHKSEVPNIVKKNL